MNYLATDELNEMPSELEQTVSLLVKSGTQQEVGVSSALSLRLPLLVHSTLKAMAEHSGLSVNRVAVQILRVGIDAVGESLPDEDAQTISGIRDRLMFEALHGNKFDNLRPED